MAEPMVSYDAIGFYLLSQEVAKHVKVVQSGQGADEIFGGYHWYPPMMESRDPVSDYARVFFDRDQAEMAQVLDPRMAGRAMTAGRSCERHFAQPGADRPIDKALRLDTNVMLVDDPVKRVDNMTMAWGLEGARAVPGPRTGRTGGAGAAGAEARRGRQGRAEGGRPPGRAVGGDRPAQGLFPGAGAEIYRRAPIWTWSATR